MEEIPSLAPVEEGTERERMLREAAERFGVADVERFERVERERLERGQMAPEREILTKTTHPEAGRWAFRSFAEKMEKSTTEAPLYGDRYAQLGMYWQAESRASALEWGRPENRPLAEFLHLEEDDIAVHHLLPPLEITEFEEYGVTPDMPKKEKEYLERENRKIRRKNEEIRQKREENEIKREQAEERREALIAELHRAAEEFAARAKFDLRFASYDSKGGSVDVIAEDFLVPSSVQLLTDDLEAIFTAPPTLYQEPGKELPEELRSSPDKEHFGNSIDKAMRAYMVVTLCEKPEELEELKKRPGWKLLFTSEEEEREYLGDLSFWKRGKRTKDDLEDEFLMRGFLTRGGNFWARKESLEDILGVRKVVVKLIGGDETAERLAFKMCRLFGIAAAGGSERYEDGVEIEGWPTTDDTIKLVQTADWQAKQTKSGYPCGPLATRQKYKRLLVDFFRFAANETDDPVREGETKNRSVWEQMWGYSADAERGLPLESGKRLGEIKWKKFPRELYRDWMLRVFLGGRKDVGLFSRLTKVVWLPPELENMVFWQEVNRDCNICINEALVINGEYRGKKEDDIKKQVAERIKKTKELFWKGIEKSLENSRWLNEPVHPRGPFHQKRIKEFQDEASYWK